MNGKVKMLKIDEPLHAEIKAHARKRGMVIQSWVETALKSQLAIERPTPKCDCHPFPMRIEFPNK